MLERLQKILSQRGIASRRKAEEYIEAGLVKVNGKVMKLGDKADPEKDRIEVDGKVLGDRLAMLYYVMNKPVGVETTNVERGKGGTGGTRGKGHQKKSSSSFSSSAPSPSSPSVRDLLPSKLQGVIFPVGRLDKDSSGLLLFTNDGVLSYRLTHPTFMHEKEYEVTLDRAVDALMLRKLQEGFMLDGSLTKPLTAWKIKPAVVRIVLTEGRNRQIRRMCQHVGYTVKDLKRVRIMTFEDPKLKPGQLRPLTKSEVRQLLSSVGLTVPAVSGSADR